MTEQNVFERLAKLLELTASNHDGEALVAVRKANETIERIGITWTEILVPVQRDSIGRTNSMDRFYFSPEGEAWGDIFRIIAERAQMSEKWQTVLWGISDYHRRSGFLTKKQSDLVMKFYVQVRDAAA